MQIMKIAAELFAVTVFFTMQLSAQRKEFSPGKIGIFMNTLSLLEPQQAAIGAGIDYSIPNRWRMSLELNYLFDGFWQGGDDHNSKGVRGIVTGKRFSKSGIFFYGLDLRIKYFSFEDKGSFVNVASNDTLFNFKHAVSNTLFGAAALVGVRLPISKNKKWALELNTGIGNKYRLVKRKSIPAGYDYYRPDFVEKHYNFTSGQDVSSSENVYFPSALRILFSL